MYWSEVVSLRGKEEIRRGKMKGKRAEENPEGHMRKHEATPAPEAGSIVTLIHRLLHAL